VILFIAANLAVGFTFITIARNQLQTMQLLFFFSPASRLFPGLMFPFRGMRLWAEIIGKAVPLTHFLRIVRVILLKGNGLIEVLSHLWPIVIFIAVAGSGALKRYQKTQV